MIPIVVSCERRRGSIRARSVGGRCKRRRRPRRHPVFGARRTTFRRRLRRRRQKDEREKRDASSRAIEKKKTGVTTPKSEGKLKKGQNLKYTYILSSKCTLIKPKIKKPKRVPRGTVGTSDEGFGGLVGYDACLTRRRSSVRLRPEIQLFFCMCVRRQSERENIMQATFKLRAKSA